MNTLSLKHIQISRMFDPLNFYCMRDNYRISSHIGLVLSRYMMFLISPNTYFFEIYTIILFVSNLGVIKPIKD